MNTLPPPTRPNYSATTITISGKWANVAVMRPGDGFAIDCQPNPNPWVRFTFTNDRGTEVSVSIHKDGIPALIAELQRITS